MPNKSHLPHLWTKLTSYTYIIYTDNFYVFLIPVKDFKISRYLRFMFAKKLISTAPTVNICTIVLNDTIICNNQKVGYFKIHYVHE